jgi:leucine dehydrogenase
MHITEIPTEGYEQVIHGIDSESGLNAFISIHSTVLGPACGGVRIWPYESEAAGLEDANLLAKAMTYKAAVADVALGGGKAAILCDPAAKSEPLLRDFGRLVESLDGRYITAKDMNVTEENLAVVREETRWVSGLSRESGSSGNPSPFTARGCLVGMKACAKKVFGDVSLKGRRVAIQGVGAVGSRLAALCLDEGASVTVCDLDLGKARAFAKEHGADVLGNAEEFIECPCDILSPCARGQVLTSEAVGRMRCAIVAGSANNMLVHSSDAEALAKAGILYAPDYVINAGGLINIACEFLPGGYSEEESIRRIDPIGDALESIFRMAHAQGITTAEAAQNLGDERLEKARAD